MKIKGQSSHIQRLSPSLLVQLDSNLGVEGEDPEAEGELVLDLEVDPPREHGDQGGDAVQVDEGLTVGVDPQHHLQAASHALDVLVVLQGERW